MSSEYTALLVAVITVVSSSLYLLAALFDTPLLAHLTSLFTKDKLYTREDWELYARERWPFFFRKLLVCRICTTPWLSALLTSLVATLLPLPLDLSICAFLMSLGLIYKFTKIPHIQVTETPQPIEFLEPSISESTERPENVKEDTIRVLGVEMEKVDGKLVIRRIDEHRDKVLSFFRDEFATKDATLRGIKVEYLEELRKAEATGNCSECSKNAIQDKYYDVVRSMMLPDLSA